jgi:hypothetical protein
MSAFQIVMGSGDEKQYSPGTVGIFKQDIDGHWQNIAWGLVEEPDGQPTPPPSGLRSWTTQVESWAWSQGDDGYFPVGGRIKIALQSGHLAAPRGEGPNTLAVTRNCRSDKYTRRNILKVPDTRPAQQPDSEFVAYELRTVVPDTPSPHVAARILREVSRARDANGAPVYVAEHWIVTDQWKFHRPRTQEFIVARWDDGHLTGTAADLKRLARELGMEGGGFYYFHLGQVS